MKKILTKKGFTLIELIVVIAILAILAAILIPSLTNYLAKAEQSKNLSNARSLYSDLMLQIATAPASIPTISATYTAAGCSATPTLAANMTTITSVTCGSGTNVMTFTP